MDEQKGRLETLVGPSQRHGSADEEEDEKKR